MGLGRGKGKDEGFTALICGCCCVVGITGIILLIVAFSKLDANEVGINYSHNSELLDEAKTYTAGTQFLGVGHGFIKYATSTQVMNFPATPVRTDEGVVVSVSAAVHYRLITNQTTNLISIYLDFGVDYEVEFREFMFVAILDAGSEYTAFEWYTYRDNITLAIKNEVARRMLDYYTIVDAFLITTVTFPPAYVLALAETETARQEQLKVPFESQQATTEIQTEVLAAVKQAQIIALTANATAQSVVYQYVAEQVRVEAITAAQVAALSSLQERLAFSQAQLVSYVWLDTLSKLGDEIVQVVTYTPPSQFELPS